MNKFYYNNTIFPRSRRHAFDTVHSIKHALEMRVLKTIQVRHSSRGKIVIFSVAPIGRCPYGMERSIFRELLAYKRSSLACAARLADTLCPPEAPFGRLGSHWLIIREIASLNMSVLRL